MSHNSKNAHLEWLQEHLSNIQPFEELRGHLAEIQPLRSMNEQLAGLRNLTIGHEHLAHTHIWAGIQDHLAELHTIGNMSAQLAELQTLAGGHEHLAHTHTLVGMQGHLAELQTLGNMSAQLAELQTLAGGHEHLTQTHTLAGIKGHLAELQTLGNMSVQLAELQTLAGGHEQFAQAQSLTGLNEHLAEIQALTNVHDWVGVSGLRQQLDEFSSRLGFTGLTQQFADFNGLTGIDWSKRLPELQALSPIMDGLANNSDEYFHDTVLRAANDIALYAGLKKVQNDSAGFEEYEGVREPQVSYGNNVFGVLPIHAQKVILKFIYDLVISFLASLMVLSIQEKYFNKVEANAADLTSPREVRRIARCDSGLDREALSQCRLVSGYDMKLRNKPNKKSSVIVTLPLGAVLKILEVSDRSWLKVEVSYEGVTLEGWVLRRYTERFR